MAILSIGNPFGATDTVTSTKLNNIADEAEFDDPVDGTTLELHTDGKLRIKPNGVGTTQIADGSVTPTKLSTGAVTPTKLSTGGPSWNSTEMVLTGGGDGANIELYGASHPSNANNIYQDADTHVFRSTDLTERVRINSDGRLLVGTTETNPSSQYDSSNPDGAAIHKSKIEVSRSGGPPFDINRGETGTIAVMRHTGTTVGTIQVSSSSTSYNTTSDYRLKEDIIEMDGSIDRLKALKPCNFRWKSDGTRVDGFIAHEAQEVVPEAVTGTKDAVDEEGNPEYQGIDQAKLVPLLTKALQEAVTKIESLETQVKELKDA